MLLMLGAATWLLAGATSVSAAPPCTLDPSVLSAYHEGTTRERYMSSLLAVRDFMEGCRSGKVAGASRAVFFDVVSRELDPSRVDTLERMMRQGGSETVAIYHFKLREFMDRIVTGGDTGFADVVLSYGAGKAIAALGPAVRTEVIRALSPPVRFYGYDGAYSSQLSALEALGYWLDPEETRFSSKDKAGFAQILTGMMEASPGARSTYSQMQLVTTLEALSRSHDEEVEKKVRVWAAQRSSGDANQARALRTADRIRDRRKGREK